MNILRQNTDPIFEIVPREEIDLSLALNMVIKSEFSQAVQEISATATRLCNENYSLQLASFPTGKIGEKFSYRLEYQVGKELLSLGRFMIISETESVQDYSKKENTKFY